MNIFKSKPNFLLLLVLVSCFATVHADPGRQLVFSWDPGMVAADHFLAARYMPGNEQAWWQGIRYGAEMGNTALMILAGVVGNVIGIYAGVWLGSLSTYQGMILGCIAGSVCGSTLGVYLVGSSGGRRGNFGSALLGSLLGELAASALALVLPRRGDSEFAFLPGFLILPPIGAAILFNRSLGSSSFQAGNGFLNLAQGKLGLGVPDIQVRPVPASGKSNKTEFGFRVNVLSVQL